MWVCSLELKPQINQELFFFFFDGREEGRGELFSRNKSFLALCESQPSLPKEDSGAREAGIANTSVKLLHMCETFSLGTWKRLIWMAQFISKVGWVLVL